MHHDWNPHGILPCSEQTVPIVGRGKDPDVPAQYIEEEQRRTFHNTKKGSMTGIVVAWEFCQGVSKEVTVDVKVNQFETGNVGIYMRKKREEKKRGGGERLSKGCLRGW